MPIATTYYTGYNVPLSVVPDQETFDDLYQAAIVYATAQAQSEGIVLDQESIFTEISYLPFPMRVNGAAPNYDFSSVTEDGEVYMIAVWMSWNTVQNPEA